jgi:integrase
MESPISKKAAGAGPTAKTGQTQKAPTVGPTRIGFTDPLLRSLRPSATARDYWDTIHRGLIVRVLPSGRVEFAVRYRFGGLRRRLKLGSYPSVSLQEARVRARRAQSAIDDGKDPAGERQTARAAKTDTVASLAADYLVKHARKRKRSWAEDERVLTVDVLPTWGERSVRDITRRDVRALIEAIAERGAPIMANRTLEIVRKMLNFGVQHEWIDANPASRIEKPGVEHQRERVLTDEEIRRLWHLLSRAPSTKDRPAPGRKAGSRRTDDPLCPISPALAAAQKMRLLTAQRGGEVIKMRWADVDLDAGWWVIPGSDAKNGRPHRVPLVAQAIEIVRAQEPKEPGARGEFIFAGRGGAALHDRAKKASAAIARVLGVDFRGHDLRRTAATRMAAAGIPRDHIAKLLNHVEGGPSATRVYDRYSYDAEKRVALETWARTLTAILEQKASKADVVPMRRTARAGR